MEHTCILLKSGMRPFFIQLILTWFKAVHLLLRETGLKSHDKFHARNLPFVLDNFCRNALLSQESPADKRSIQNKVNTHQQTNKKEQTSLRQIVLSNSTSKALFDKFIMEHIRGLRAPSTKENGKTACRC